MKLWRFEFKYVTPEKEETVVYDPLKWPLPIKSTMPKKPVAKKAAAKKATVKKAKK
jgi:hypothetical protein